jgi:F-type H+-transporting ATPase subunit gamma
MSQLIQMRQRIKAVETIKKITHAMRLIAMSSHARLRTQAAELSAYQQELTALFSLFSPQDPAHETDTAAPSPSTKELLILIGSQKGLCGNFNNELMYFLKNYTATTPSVALIVVGKKVKDYLDEKQRSLIIKEFDQLRGANLTLIARELITHLQAHSYKQAGIISNISKSFFIQRATYAALPLTTHLSSSNLYIETEEYRWYQPPHIIATALSHELLYSRIYERLLSSLIAEQAARFVAMDASTRNAQNLLDDMKLSYNKLRQSKITRELTDLVGSFFKTV